MPFLIKNYWYFFISPQKHVLRYSLEASSHWCTSDEYPISMFSWRNKKNINLIPFLSRAMIYCIFGKIFSHVWANSIDPDQTAPRGAVWSGSILFVIQPALLIHQLVVASACSNFRMSYCACSNFRMSYCACSNFRMSYCDKCLIVTITIVADNIL